MNRATPKTQSACLQAMQEGEVSIDGVTYQLPEPFIVVATQNPLDSTGTFPLPESQLDRFLMKIDVGWPDRATERRIIADEGARPAPEDLEPVLGGEEVLEIRRLVRGLHLSEEVLDYIQDMVAESRNLSAGLSTRAAMDLAAARLKPGGLLAASYNALPGGARQIPFQHMIRALADMNSIAKSRSLTASREFSVTPSKPNSLAVYSRSIG